jgi:hypothetical protein
MAESNLTSPTESEKPNRLDTVLIYGVPLRLAKVEDAGAGYMNTCLATRAWMQSSGPRFGLLP